MPARGRTKAVPLGLQSNSTPNLPTLSSLESPARSHETQSKATRPLSPTSLASPSDPAFGEDALQDDGQHLLASHPSDSSGSESDNAQPVARPLHTSRSQTHLAPHGSMLFPPFYNRPPTPLPPSPSLVSLLRPSISAATSRPTTPDSSDIEGLEGSRTATGGTSTPASSAANLASITKSARHAPTVPRAAPKVPTYEYYGFALYLASSAAFLLYIVWAYVPSPLLHQMGIHYYPNRWWALAVPCWLVVLVMYIYAALASYNTRYLTLPLGSCENLVDDTAQIAVVDRLTGRISGDQATGSGTGRQAEDGAATGSIRRSSMSKFQFSASEDADWESFWSISTDAVLDVPIGGVCEILYGRAASPE